MKRTVVIGGHAWKVRHVEDYLIAHSRALRMTIQGDDEADLRRTIEQALALRETLTRPSREERRTA